MWLSPGFLPANFPPDSLNGHGNNPQKHQRQQKMEEGKSEQKKSAVQIRLENQQKAKASKESIQEREKAAEERRKVSIIVY